MSKREPSDRSRRQSVYGTQVPAGSQPESADVDPPEAARSGARSSAHGTQFAPAPDAVTASLVKCPENVVRTHGAGSTQLRDVLQQVRTMGSTRVTTHKGSTEQKSPESPPRSVGKSTWNLRIRERGVAGKISGIINEIPEDQSAVSGLQSALVFDESLPEYEVIEKLGAGNMGLVYRARQTSLNRELAIKTLRSDAPNADHDQSMFVSEAVVTAHLVHPNIVPIHDLGRTADGKLFYSMKRVTGTGWNDSLRTFSLEQNLDIFMKVCDAVAYAHSKGVINRDLKPENVIVGDFGEVVVLDWGLALTSSRFSGRDSVVVDFRGGAGSPAYMAPEMASEDIGDVGEHSDIYLLGAVLFEILEGFPPHWLKDFHDIQQPDVVLNCVVDAVVNNRIESDVTNEGELMQIARKAMSTFPMDRWGSVEELQDAVQEYRITGRAEELMSQVERDGASKYSPYQGAVALYDEALRKWPGNRRAEEGDRRARTAYAELALKKGDVDLGLEVVSDDGGQRFGDLRRQLKRTRRNRKIMRGTWSLATIAAFVAAAVAGFFYLDATLEKNKVLELNGTVNDLTLMKESLDDANRTLAGEQERLSQEKQSLIQNNVALEESKSTLQTEKEMLEFEKKQLVSDKERLQQEKLVVEKEKQVIEQEKAAAVAETATAVAEKDAAVIARESAQAEAAAAELKIEIAELEQYEALRAQVNAYCEIAQYDKIIELISRELDPDNPSPNPFVEQNRKSLEEWKSDAENATCRLRENFHDVVPARNARVLAVRTGRTLRVYRGVENPNDLNAQTGHELSLRSPKPTISVSSDGSFVAVVGSKARQVWAWDGSKYVEADVAANPSGVAFQAALFSANGERIYFVGADKAVTVEAFKISDGRLTPVSRSVKLFGNTSNQPGLIDVALMPQETGLVAITGMYNVRFFPIVRSEDRFEFSLRKSNELVEAAFPALDGLVGLEAQRILPIGLEISPDGRWLSLIDQAEHGRILLLPEADDRKGFPFANPRASGLRPIRMSFSKPVTDLRFSADSSHFVASQFRYVQVWQLDDSDWSRSDFDDLYAGHSLAGHSEEISTVSFLGQSVDRIMSFSTENDVVRLWDAPRFGELVDRMTDVKKTLVRKPKTKTTRRSDSRLRSENRVVDPSQNRYMTVSLPQPPAPATGRRIRQGRKIFSAEFSRDGQRIIVGANDLAAHAFEAEEGRRTLTASMFRPRDPFFAPERNNFLEGHIPEIVSLKFLPPDGELLLTFDYFGSLAVWDARDDEDGIGYEKARLLPSEPLDDTSPGRPYEVEDPSCEVAVSDDGQWLMAGVVRNNGADSIRGSVDEYFPVLWRTEDILKSGRAVPYRELKGEFDFQITAAAFSPDGRRAVAASRRGRFVLWEVETGRVLARKSAAHNSDSVTGIFFTSETEFVSAGFDGRVLNWTIADGQMTAREITRPEGDKLPDFVIRLRPNPGGTAFITSDLRKEAAGQYRLTLNHWSEATGWTQLPISVLAPEEDLAKPYRHDVSWSDDASEVLFVHDGRMILLESGTWKEKRGFELPTEDHTIRGAFAPKDAGNCVATFDGRFAHLWDLTTGRHVSDFRSHGPLVRAVFSADRKFVLTGSDSLRVFNSDEDSPDHGRPEFRLSRRVIGQRSIDDVCFSPLMDEHRFLSVDSGGTVKLWDWEPGQAPPTKPAFVSEPSDAMDAEWLDVEGVQALSRIKWNDDGSIVAAIRRGRLTVWRVEGGEFSELEIEFPDQLGQQDMVFNALDFSANGKRIAAGGVLYDERREKLNSWGTVFEVQGDRLVPVLVIEAEGTTVSTHSISRITGDDLRPVGITAIAFDPASDEIVTGGSDARILEWQMVEPNENRLLTLAGNGARELPIGNRQTESHKGAVIALDVSMDGRFVSADAAGWVYIWPGSQP